MTGIKDWVTDWAANYKPDTTLILDKSTGIVYGPGGQYVTTNESVVGATPDEAKDILAKSADTINKLNLANSQGIIAIGVIALVAILIFRR
jgi:hypothetical protein